ncbi:MAG: zf-HC2 domain-containing protein [Anaerolineae bacterium]
MKCDIGRVQAYADDVLEGRERATLEDHLARCSTCRETLEAIQQRERSVAVRLAVLDPAPHEIPDAKAALARFHATAQPVVTPSRETLKERIEMMKETLLTSRWRPAAIGLVAVAVVVALFSFAPARHAAAQFLGIFRVRKFAVIPIDPAQVERLQSLEDSVDAGMLGEPTFLREPGDLQPVADAAEASALAGFGVRVPTGLPEGATLSRFGVATGPAMHYEVDRVVMQTLLAAAGASDVALPAIDNIAVDVDVPAMVEQEYRVGKERFSIIQLPSPTVALPAGVDPAVLGETLLQLLGMPGEDARRLAQSIDWTSTLVIPLPTNVGSFHEVEVDGVTGLLLEEKRENRPYRRHRMVLWEREGIVYSISGENTDPTELLLVANSLR